MFNNKIENKIQTIKKSIQLELTCQTWIIKSREPHEKQIKTNYEIYFSIKKRHQKLLESINKTSDLIYETSLSRKSDNNIIITL